MSLLIYAVCMLKLLVFDVDGVDPPEDLAAPKSFLKRKITK